MEFMITLDPEAKIKYAFLPIKEQRAKLYRKTRLTPEFQSKSDSDKMIVPLKQYLRYSNSRQGLVGFKNIGNTCFMASIL